MKGSPNMPTHAVITTNWLVPSWLINDPRMSGGGYYYNLRVDETCDNFVTWMYRNLIQNV